MSRSLGDVAKEYEDLIRQEKALKVSGDEISARKSDLEEELMEALVGSGLQNCKTESGMSLFLRVDRFVALAEGVTSEQLAQELAQHECTRDLVAPKYNANSLRSRLREIEENGEDLPASLQKMVKIIEKDRIGHKG